MRSKLMMKNYNDERDLVVKSPEELIKQISNIEENLKVINQNNKYYVYNRDDLLCTYNISYEVLYDCVINIFYEDKTYHYYCDYNTEGLKISLKEYIFNENDKEYRIIDSNHSFSIDITNKNRGLAIIVNGDITDMNNFKNLIKTINFEDNLESIYNKLIILFSSEDIMIKKYVKLNTCDNREKITDLLEIKKGELLEYLTNENAVVSGKERQYVFKKENNNYSITFVNGSVDDFTSSYFIANSQVRFVKSLESKQQAYTKALKK